MSIYITVLPSLLVGHCRHKFSNSMLSAEYVAEFSCLMLHILIRLVLEIKYGILLMSSAYRRKAAIHIGLLLRRHMKLPK